MSSNDQVINFGVAAVGTVALYCRADFAVELAVGVAAGAAIAGVEFKPIALVSGGVAGMLVAFGLASTLSVHQPEGASPSPSSTEDKLMPQGDNCPAKPASRARNLILPAGIILTG